MPEPFNLAEVNDAIAGTEFHGWLMNFPTVPSTNDLALRAAQAGSRHGVWIADEQTAGRGRGGHTWHSPAGSGLYMTALISPPIPMQSALRLSLRAALAVQAAIASTFGFRIREQIDIRWPNDLMLTRPNGPARKCGGILIDTASNPASSTQPATLRYAVIGIGINVNQTAFPPELDTVATSLLRELSPSAPLRREPLAAAILIALDTELRCLSTNNQQLTKNNLSQYSTWLSGKRVRVEARDPAPNQPSASYTGTTAGLNPSGFLLVRDDDGLLRTVLSGGLREP